MFWNRKDELKPFLPDFEVIDVVQTLSQTVDWGLKMLKVPPIWDSTKGEGIKVAILDTGRPLDHPDLEGNIKGAANFTTDSDVYDRQSGHSTHVGGIIGALDNQTGVVGVAPEVDLYFGKVLSNSGHGKFEWITKGIEWCIDLQADIISMSLGSTANPPNSALKKAIDKATSKNIVCVAAAGNEGVSKSNYPAKYENVISVAAVSKNKSITSWSNTGTDVEFSAPGDNIYSTYLDGRYAILSGTSQAAPFVSGIIALLMSYHRKGNHTSPCTNLKEVREHLIKISDDLGQVGRDDTFGYGIPNLEKFGTDILSKDKCCEPKGCLWPF